MLRTKIPVRYQNPHATAGLTLDLDVIENTPIDEISNHVKKNSREYSNWLQFKDEHNGSAIMVAGGDSINDHIDDIKRLKDKGGAVFAMNGASKWCHKHGIDVDYQVILDAKQETSYLVDPQAKMNLISSQCHPDTFKQVDDPVLWHLIREDIESWIPEDRVNKGGYVMVGGDSSAGICALCLAYTQGFRHIHVFGYDTSHRDGKGHAYEQRMNDTMPTMPMEWGGKEYQVSIALKDQPQNFMTYTHELERVGCQFTVYGDGILQAIYHTDASTLTEQEKYKLMWMFPAYRTVSPGASVASFYVHKFHPEGEIYDFGCGTGKASVVFKKFGLNPVLIDFADNCRDPEAGDLPFFEWDLTDPIPGKTKHGFCTDVMEHIPEKDVDKVIQNIMNCAEKVFFQISTEDDCCGSLIGATLHHTIKPHKWWYNKFQDYDVIFDHNLGSASLFYVSRRDN